jgi:hypothetical protein
MSTIMKDLWLTEEGEPVLENGDFAISLGTDSLLQNILYRLKTVISDWVLCPECGASLEQLIGEPNSQETADRMEEQVLYALTHDGFLFSDELEIITLPVDKNTILLTVFVTFEGKQTSLAFTLDLKEGLIAFQGV